MDFEASDATNIWRVICCIDGAICIETQSEEEARAKAEIPGHRLERLYEKTVQGWKQVV